MPYLPKYIHPKLFRNKNRPTNRRTILLLIQVLTVYVKYFVR
jgi:hypothetical protein